MTAHLSPESHSSEDTAEKIARIKADLSSWLGDVTDENSGWIRLAASQTFNLPLNQAISIPYTKEQIKLALKGYEHIWKIEPHADKRSSWLKRVA